MSPIAAKTASVGNKSSSQAQGNSRARGSTRTLIDGASLNRIRKLSRIMDSQFQVPGTKIKFGLDSIVGLVPGVGDVVTTAVPVWILYEAHKAGVSRWTLSRMAGNVAVDAVVGMVPLVGDLFDVYWKANVKNLRLLEKELGR